MAEPAPGDPAAPGAFLEQLTRPAFVLDLRRAPGPRPGPLPEPRAAAPAGQRPRPAVLLLSRARDAEFGEVARLLRRVGVPCFRIDADDLPAAGLRLDPGRGLVHLDGRWVIPAVTWLRHFSARAVEPATGPAQVFAQDSWAAAADGLAEVSAVTVGFHRPGLVAQLRLAARHGVRVPRTCVSTDPAQLAGQFTGPRVIVKALHRHFVEAAPGLLTGVFPVIMTLAELSAQPPLGVPVVVQEYVEHQAELRVYHVGGQLHGFRIGKRSPADLWLDPARVTAEPVPLSPAVAGAAETLASASGLRYGAFDFLVQAGEPVFLEVNVDGDWRWIEHETGTSPVSEAAAVLLHGLYQAQLPATGGRAEPFSLLNFLAG